MTAIETEFENIQAKVGQLVGKKPWRVQLGVGSFITFDFGEKKIEQKGKRQVEFGEWHLWVTYCAWRIDHGAEIIAGSEDESEALKQKVEGLEGLTVQSVQVAFTGETTITFNNEIVLRLFPIHSREYEHWMLYTPDNNVLVIGPGSSCSYQSADKP